MQLSHLISILVGLVGAAVAIYAVVLRFRLEKRPKVVDYEVLQTPILRLDPEKDKTIIASVDKFLLTGEEKDKGVLTPVDNAYCIHVALQNNGYESIVEPKIEIRLDEDAKIINYKTEPLSSPGYKIVADNSLLKSNILLLSLPHLNKDESLFVNIISVNNTNSECMVKVIGTHIETRLRPSLQKKISRYDRASFIFGGICFASFFAFYYYELLDQFPPVAVFFALIALSLLVIHKIYVENPGKKENKYQKNRRKSFLWHTDQKKEQAAK